jgi:hypothetical protein
MRTLQCFGFQVNSCLINDFRSGLENLNLLGIPYPPPLKVRRGRFNVPKLSCVNLINRRCRAWKLKRITPTYLEPPHARSHLHLARLHPSHASFTARSSPCSLPTPAWEPFLVGNQCDKKLYQNHKSSTWYHFHFSRVNWQSSFTRQRSLMVEMTERLMKVISTWIFATLIYFHGRIGSQWGWVPTQVRAWSTGKTRQQCPGRTNI